MDIEHYVALSAWLADVAADASFSAVDQVAVQIHQVSVRNRLGAVDLAPAEQLARAAERIRPQQPHVACHADAVVAIRHQNRFDFARANEGMAVWASSLDNVFGAARWKGRAASQIGQAAAFAGDPARARKLFMFALVQFGSIDDPSLRRQERGQSATYCTIATLDDPGVSIAAKRRMVDFGAGLVPNLLQSIAAYPSGRPRSSGRSEHSRTGYAGASFAQFHGSSASMSLLGCVETRRSTSARYV